MKKFSQGKKINEEKSFTQIDKDSWKSGNIVVTNYGAEMTIKDGPGKPGISLDLDQLQNLVDLLTELKVVNYKGSEEEYKDSMNTGESY